MKKRWFKPYIFIIITNTISALSMNAQLSESSQTRTHVLSLYHDTMTYNVRVRHTCIHRHFIDILSIVC